jgi:hypothetical protein
MLFYVCFNDLRFLCNLSIETKKSLQSEVVQIYVRSRVLSALEWTNAKYCCTFSQYYNCSVIDLILIQVH